MNKADSTSPLESFLKYLEKKVGYIRRDPETLSCLKEIMETKESVFGDLYAE